MAEETGDLDAILDNALDQFVDELDEEQGDVNATVSKAAKDTALQSTEDDKRIGSSQGNDVIAESMADLMDKMKDPEFASTLEDTFKKLASGGTPENPEDPFAALHQGATPWTRVSLRL